MENLSIFNSRQFNPADLPDFGLLEPTYKTIMINYFESCFLAGNKKNTVIEKYMICKKFLLRLQETVQDIATADTRTILKIVKECEYAASGTYKIKQFFKYLYSTGVLDKDYAYKQNRSWCCILHTAASSAVLRYNPVPKPDP